MTALFTGSGAWTRVCPTSWRLLDAGVTSMGRQMLRISPDCAQNWSKERIFGTLGLLDTAGLLALERLRFLAQLCRTGPDAVFALLQHSRQALDALRDAMQWFVQAVGATSSLGTGEDWSQWCALFQQKGKFAGMLKRATCWHVARLQACAHFQLFCRRTWAPAPEPEVVIEHAQHMCLICNIAFFDFHAWSAHAARAHGYQARCVRFAQGKRCRACGMVFPTAIRHRRHLQTHVVCCRAVEWGVPELLSPLLGPDGHEQEESVAGFGTAHLPAFPEDISVALLGALRCSEFGSDCEIFETVKGFVEPFPMLRATLAYWHASLSPSPVKEWASDVLLCMQVELWCDSASRVPRAVSQRSADFCPLIRPLYVGPDVAEAPALVVSAAAFAASDKPVYNSSLGPQLDFWEDVPTSIPIGGLKLSIPAPPVPVLDLWSFASCSLRRVREHGLWLSQTLAWVSLTVKTASAGHQCSISAAFAKGSMGVLADWLLEASQTSQSRSSLSLRFTS